MMAVLKDISIRTRHVYGRQGRWGGKLDVRDHRLMWQFFRKCCGRSVFLMFASHGLVAVATTVSLHTAVESEGKDEQAHGGAKLVLWSTCFGYERSRYKV